MVRNKDKPHICFVDISPSKQWFAYVGIGDSFKCGFGETIRQAYKDMLLYPTNGELKQLNKNNLKSSLE